MKQDNPSDQGARSRGPFWRSRAGIVLIAFLAIGALLLGYEHRVHIFSGNGLLVACIAMHLFMHHGLGGHGGGGNDGGGGRLVLSKMKFALAVRTAPSRWVS